MLSKIYHLLSQKQKKYVNRHFAFLSPKPYVLSDNLDTGLKYPNGEKGGVIITADFELAWAVRYSRSCENPLENAKRERENVPVIIDTLERYSIPITWATVGHLFLTGCKKGDHDWLKRIPYFTNRQWEYTKGDWFDCDPYSNVENSPEWYAPDLIKLILDSGVKHEIGCHTFSHIDCSDNNCPPQVIDDELTACEQSAESWGIEFRSMAFPAGTAGNFEILKKHGIKIYRRRTGKYEIGYPFRDRTGLLVSLTGPGIKVRFFDGNINNDFRRYKKAVDKALRNNSLIHLWFHPSEDVITITRLFPAILEYLAEQRDRKVLWVGTMDEMQEHINQNNIL